MSAHTAGPWRVGEDGDIWAANGQHCVALIPDTLGNDANAALIAAAPAMCAALRRVLEASEHGRAVDCLTLDDVRAALHLADGGAE